MARKPRGAVGRGGPRAGTPGTAYSNRTDLQSPGNLPYGQAQELAQSGQVMQQAAQAGRPPVPPPQPFNRPTERPNEPVTAGLPFGAGPGPEVLPQVPQPGAADIALLNTLRGAYMAYPNEDLRQIIAQMEQAQR